MFSRSRKQALVKTFEVADVPGKGIGLNHCSTTIRANITLSKISSCCQVHCPKELDRYWFRRFADQSFQLQHTRKGRKFRRPPRLHSMSGSSS